MSANNRTLTPSQSDDRAISCFWMTITVMVICVIVVGAVAGIITWGNNYIVERAESSVVLNAEQNVEIIGSFDLFNACMQLAGGISTPYNKSDVCAAWAVNEVEQMLKNR